MTNRTFQFGIPLFMNLLNIFMSLFMAYEPEISRNFIITQKVITVIIKNYLEISDKLRFSMTMLPQFDKARS